MIEDDPEELDLEPRASPRIRGPRRARTWGPPTAKTKKACNEYKGPTYYNPVGADAAHELPTMLISTPKPKKKGPPTVPCAGVPDKSPCNAMISGGGNRKRCPACSDLMARYRVSQKSKKAKEKDQC